MLRHAYAQIISLRLRRIIFALTLAGFATACATPTPLRDHVAQGNQYAKDGLLREAADSYRRALSKTPENLTAHRNLGMVLVKTGDYRGAVQHLEKCLASFESDYDANFYLAEAYRAQDQYAKAIFHYQVALKARENEPRASKALAWSFYKIRYYSEALSLASRLHSTQPEDEQSSIILARTLLKLKRTAEAINTIRTAMNKANKQSIPYFRSVEGDIFYEAGDRPRATESYRLALKEQPLLASALLGMGRALFEDGKGIKAVPYLERAVRVRPQLTEAHLLLGKAYEKTDPRKAVKYYQIFRKQAAADPEYLDQLGEIKQKIGLLRDAGSLSKEKVQ